MKISLVYTTVSTFEEAQILARSLIEGRLAVCVQIAKKHSIYKWKGKLEECEEWSLLIKTLEEKKESLLNQMINFHPY